ncbi:MAG: hypothetical protein AB7O57_03120 [Hyphomicrobiaceae bacterium]
MSRNALDRATPPPAFASLPLRIEPSGSPASKITRALLLVPALLAAAVPLASAALASASEPAILAALADRPVAAVQIGLGIVVWAGLFLWPARRALDRLWRRRQVVVHATSVEMIEVTPLGSRRREIPIGDYRGLAHHIRASLSGLTHEIVLVHADPALDVTLHSADRVTQAMIDSAKAMLGLPEVPARTLYERGRIFSPVVAGEPLQPMRA